MKILNHLMKRLMFQKHRGTKNKTNRNALLFDISSKRTTIWQKNKMSFNLLTHILQFNFFYCIWEGGDRNLHNGFYCFCHWRFESSPSSEVIMWPLMRKNKSPLHIFSFKAYRTHCCTWTFMNQREEKY